MTRNYAQGYARDEAFQPIRRCRLSRALPSRYIQMTIAPDRVRAGQSPNALDRGR